jgi:copper oxidase (laccase) domain-containing protein
MLVHPLVETFPALAAIPGLRHGFLLRVPGIDVAVDREAALARLREAHGAALSGIGVDPATLATGQQVHGDEVAVCDEEAGPVARHYPDCDGLVTATPGQHVGVYVADCGAVFLIDPRRRACGVVHSGRKGSELGIALRAIEAMRERYGSRPEDLVVQLAPCIRPPAYEVDFAARILEDCASVGVPVEQIHDCGTCTSSDPERYYSYRMEMGKTGRLFAVAGWAVG